MEENLLDVCFYDVTREQWFSLCAIGKPCVLGSVHTHRRKWRACCTTGNHWWIKKKKKNWGGGGGGTQEFWMMVVVVVAVVHQRVNNSQMSADACVSITDTVSPVPERHTQKPGLVHVHLFHVCTPPLSSATCMRVCVCVCVCVWWVCEYVCLGQCSLFILSLRSLATHPNAQTSEGAERSTSLGNGVCKWPRPCAVDSEKEPARSVKGNVP